MEVDRVDLGMIGYQAKGRAASRPGDGPIPADSITDPRRDVESDQGSESPVLRLVSKLVQSIMAATQKVTVEVPAELLRRARRSTGQGITATLRRGLELVAARNAYEELRRMRGKVKLALDLDALRQDRR